MDCSRLRPKDWTPSTVAGQLHHWLRIRIASGGYGRDARYRKTVIDGKDSYTLDLATWRPPSLNAITCSYEYSSPTVIPRHVLVEGNFSLQDQTTAIARGWAGFMLSPPADDMSPALYLGFARPGPAPTFDNRPVTLYFGVEQNVYRPRWTTRWRSRQEGRKSPGSIATRKATGAGSGHRTRRQVSPGAGS